jgi:hypothetical protein
VPPDRTDVSVSEEHSRFDRARVRLGEHIALAIAVVLVVALVGGWVTYAAHFAPQTDERVVGEVEGDGEFDYGATVQRDNSVYPTGTRLEDRRHFVTRIAPELNGTYAYRYGASNAADVSVETVLLLHLRAVDDGAVYWETTDRLAVERTKGADGTVTVPFSVNVSALAERSARIEDEMGETPGDVEASLVARTQTTGTTGGRSLAGFETKTLPIETTTGTYRVGDQRASVESDPVVVERETVRGDAGPVRAYGGPLGLLAGVFGLLALAVGRRWGRLSPPARVRRRIDERRAREEFDEWITRGRVPGELLEGPFVEVESLSGLVDVAIDGDDRVIEDVERGAFYVVGGETVYLYQPDGAWVQLSDQEA